MVRMLDHNVAFHLQDVSVRAGRRTLLDSVCVEASLGELVGVLGPAGAGKSVFLKLLHAGLRPTSGQADVLGGDLFMATRGHRRRSLLVAPGGVPAIGWTLEDYISVVAAAFGIDRRVLKVRFTECHPERISLSTRCSALDISERVHAAVSLADALDLRLLLLDGPLSDLGPLSVEEIWMRLAGLGKMTIVIAMRSYSEAFRFDRILLLHRGEALVSARPEDLKNYAADIGFHRIFTRPDAAMLERLRTEASVLSVVALAGGLRVALRREGRSLEEILTTHGLDAARHCRVTPRVDEVVRLLLHRRRGGIA